MQERQKTTQPRLEQLARAVAAAQGPRGPSVAQMLQTSFTPLPRATLLDAPKVCPKWCWTLLLLKLEWLSNQV